MAQVHPGLRLGRVRPQHERDTLARQGPIAVQQQVGQQALGARGVQHHGLVSEAQAPAAQ
ncbi:MAG: hypothetical protein M3O70_16275 [Actinomycetota bacterium]|nr:hypothetical protein [Actinomycetota bacterium]